MKKKAGLCLAGGGITGAMYEVGALAAIEDAFHDFQACDFDVFVGSSAGSCVATALAGGIPAQRLYRALLSPTDDFFPLQRQHLLRLDLKEMQRVFRSAVGAARRMLGSVTSRPLEVDVWTELERFVDSLPAGLFSMDSFEDFFREFMQRRGLPRSFDDYARTLFLVASDLDGGQRVVFGSGEGAERAPLPRAIAAANAVPILFAPVRIDGRDLMASPIGEAAHADLALAEGCEMILIINPMVPVKSDPGERTIPTGHGTMTRVRDKGLLWVHSQSWRLASEARLVAGIENLQAANPEVAIHLVEPERDEVEMFMHSPMNFAARRVILEDGYTRTLRRLRNPESRLRRSLEELGLVPKERESVVPGP